MAFHPQEGVVNAGKECGGNGGRASSSYDASSSSHESGNAPPPAQQMDRQLHVGSGEDDGRIPASVFERDASESNQDWSMMSTESVFALQVAPSCDFTGYFLAHPELMDMSTPPHSSAGGVDSGAAIEPQFDSIPELSDSTLVTTYSFAFPDLTKDKRYNSKKTQALEEPPSPVVATPVATSTTKMETAKMPPPVVDTSSTPEAEPEKPAAKGGLLSCFPCCSS